MSGHNKWSQIKHKKAKEDAKRGQAFTKLTKEITVAARAGGGDPAHNSHLRLLLEKAKQVNMPLENSQRAIKKGTGELPGVSYESFTYEGYGPYGIAIMVEVLSDNKNRTVAELRRLFNEYGGTLGESGTVAWMFERKSIITIKTDLSEDGLLELLIDADVEVDDIQNMNDDISIISDPKTAMRIKQILDTIACTLEDASIGWIAKGKVELPDEKAAKAYEFLEALDNHDDVQNVYTNLA
ncbi:MAG TPA: YebC/PmpR family DNA-binding transcriptional regulator [Candidatus Babeliales bacterium]|nr:YebC/PmpR family DNA-binding transcriptional regulator [Candidatus Babeliales bacterium]